MRYSTFNWAHRGKRGWIIGPFFGRLLTITVEQKPTSGPNVVIYNDRAVQTAAAVRDAEERLAKAHRDAHRA